MKRPWKSDGNIEHIKRKKNEHRTQTYIYAMSNGQRFTRVRKFTKAKAQSKDSKHKEEVFFRGQRVTMLKTKPLKWLR